MRPVDRRHPAGSGSTHHCGGTSAFTLYRGKSRWKSRERGLSSSRIKTSITGKTPANSLEYRWVLSPTYHAIPRGGILIQYAAHVLCGPRFWRTLSRHIIMLQYTLITAVRSELKTTNKNKDGCRRHRAVNHASPIFFIEAKPRAILSLTPE